MSVQLRVDHASKTVVAKAEGPVTSEEVRKHLLEERHYGGLPYAEIIDARTFRPAFSSEEVREIVGLLRSFGQSSKLGPTAVVVGSPIAYGMMRMLEILAEDVCAIRPFWTMEEAEAWIEQLRTAPPGTEPG
jgi:hypothetical protein